MASPTGASWNAYERQQTAKAKAKKAKAGKSNAVLKNNESVISAYRSLKAGSKKPRTPSSRHTRGR
jgi:hypothetical protein